MEPNARITQKDLADKLRLSQATVSRALSESPLIPAETIRRVREEAERLGYRPDPALASLNAYLHAKRPISQGSLIAWLGRNPIYRMEEPHVWDASIFRAAKKRGEELGYKVDYFWINDPDLPVGRLEKILDTRGVQGIVLDKQARPHGHMRFRMERASIVAIGRSLHSPRVDQVGPDHFMALITCYRKLLSLGYRRIGLAVSQKFNERSMGHWQAAYMLEHLRKKNLPTLPIYSRYDMDKKAFAAWLRKAKPDCVITTLESYPYERRQNRAEQIEELGFQIPDDIGVAVLNLTESPSLSRFSGIVEPLEEIGVASINVLVSLIRHNLRGIPKSRIVSLIEGKWRNGQTIRAKA